MTPESQSRNAGGSFPGAGVLAAAAALAGLLPISCASSPPAPPSPPAPVSASGAVSAPSPAKSVPPEALAGNWLLEVKIGSRTVEGGLHFANSNGVLVGTETSAEGNEFELKNISITGDRISWDMDGASGSQHVTGTIDGLSMKGAMKRVASRRGGREAGPEDSQASEEQSPSVATGGRSGGGRSGRRRGRGGSGGGAEITWSAWKTMMPSGEPPPGPIGSPGL